MKGPETPDLETLLVLHALEGNRNYWRAAFAGNRVVELWAPPHTDGRTFTVRVFDGGGEPDPVLPTQWTELLAGHHADTIYEALSYAAGVLAGVRNVDEWTRASRDIPTQADIEFLYALQQTNGYWYGDFCAGRFSVEIWGPDEPQVLVVDATAKGAVRRVEAVESVGDAFDYAATTIARLAALPPV